MNFLWNGSCVGSARANIYNEASYKSKEMRRRIKEVTMKTM
jgi:hypothetical protein